MINLRRKPVVIALSILLVIVLILLAISVFSTYKPQPKDVLSSDKYLQGSSVVYQYSDSWLDTLSPGNDSHVNSIVRLRPQMTRSLLDASDVFQGCASSNFRCVNGPVWRSRTSFIRPNGLGYQESDLRNMPTILKAYKSVTQDPGTLCAARIYKSGDVAGMNPDMSLVCVEPSTDLLVYEYASGQDTKNPN